ncbi:MAG: gluconokinase [Acidimicrobiaceae bacterium]|nr:gluconokinase [Acidimicrobiaceae bacterium]
MTRGEQPAHVTSTCVARPRAIVVLGVSGSGKSTVGRSLAERLGYDFCDADDLHSPANIAKMSSGRPLNDEDRVPWLNAVGHRMRETLDQGRGVVVACSALKKSYRDLLRRYEPATFCVFLDGSPELILSRVVARARSFMPPSLQSSQFATLEPLGVDEEGVKVDVSGDVADTVDAVLAALSAHSHSEETF